MTIEGIIDGGTGPNVYIVRGMDSRMCAVRGLEAMEYREAIYIAEMYLGVPCTTSMGIVGAKLLPLKSPYRQAAEEYENGN